MARFGAGKTSAVVMGGLLCLGLIFVGIAATIVLSLIPVYTSNDAKVGYGEEYRLDATMLKALYTDADSSTYAGAAIGNNAALSTACTSQLSSDGASSVAGCVLENGVAYGPYSNSDSSRRRRQNTVLGLYAIYQTRVFFSTSCSKTADQNKTQSSSGLSNCVKKRLQQCNKLINNDGTASGTKRWSSISSLALSVYVALTNSYESITSTGIYGFPASLASSTAVSLGLATGTKTSLSNGCRYVGPLPLADIAAAIASQSTVTTTPYSTQAMG